MENGLAVKTSSEDSGEASKNDTGSSADEMDVDLSEGWYRKFLSQFSEMHPHL